MKSLKGKKGIKKGIKKGGSGDVNRWEQLVAGFFVVVMSLGAVFTIVMLIWGIIDLALGHPEWHPLAKEGFESEENDKR